MDTHPQTGPEARITVDEKEVTIHRGRQSVAEIKKAAGVPAAHDLEQVIGEQLTLLADDASVTLKGGEVFISHMKSGAAS